MTAADVILLVPAVGLLLITVLAACYWPGAAEQSPAVFCPIHGVPCPEPAECVVVYQAECAAQGLPLLDTGGAA